VLSTWEPIATIGFVPHFSKDKKGVLCFDQLQGGGTNHGTETEEGREAKKLFKSTATYALYQVGEELAKRAGFRGIGLRKKKDNDWPSVSFDQKKRRPPYEVIPEIEQRRMRRGELSARLRTPLSRSEYNYKPLTNEESEDAESQAP
jgi:hypothetical protein